MLPRDADRITYLELLREYSQLYGPSLLGYCLMSNHVHLIAVPHTAEALSHSLKQDHGRYAAYWNARQSSTGHVWQGRFYSCPRDESHLWAALLYGRVESGARGHGRVGGSLDMVECCRTLRPDGSPPDAGNGALEEAMDGGGVE